MSSADLLICGSFLKHFVEEDPAAVDGLPGRLGHNQLSPQAQQMENGHVLVSSETLRLGGMFLQRLTYLSGKAYF